MLEQMETIIKVMQAVMEATVQAEEEAVLQP
jgi:hypothetical protein